MFLEILNEVGNHIVLNNEYSLEFANDGVFLLVFVRFWIWNQMCRVFLKRTGRTHGQTQAEIALISCVMGAVSTGPEIISVTGCTSKTVQLLDDSPYGQYAVQSPPRFEELQLRTLMHKKNCSIFGHIDFFGVLHHLVVSLGLGLELEWVMLSPELSKVMSVFIMCYPPFWASFDRFYFVGDHDLSARSERTAYSVSGIAETLAQSDCVLDAAFSVTRHARSPETGWV